MSAPTNITVTPSSGRYYGYASCLYKGARFHIWLEENVDRTTVYKNPPLGTKPSDPGYFNTRKLDSAKGQGKVVFDALMAAAPELLKAAKEARARADEDRRLADEKAQREEAARKLLEGAAEEMLETLRRAEVTLRTNDAWVGLADECKRVIAKATGGAQ